MEVRNSTFPSIEQVTGKYLSPQVASAGRKSDGVSFQGILQEKFRTQNQDTLKFSKHANERLSDRNISLTDEQMERLENGTKKAEEKGINESLVLVDQLAFIVNIKNNTVITAMEQGETTDSIFTNIDGAVII